MPPGPGATTITGGSSALRRAVGGVPAADSAGFASEAEEDGACPEGAGKADGVASALGGTEGVGPVCSATGFSEAGGVGSCSAEEGVCSVFAGDADGDSPADFSSDVSDGAV